MHPGRPTIESLAAEVSRLKDLLLNDARLFRKDLMRRYGFSERTMDRRRSDPKFPKPIIEGGRPKWRPADIEQAEMAGQLPRPVSA